MKRLFIITLTIMAIGMAAAGVRAYAQEPEARIVTVSAKRFEFTPSQITLRRGERVTLRVNAQDRDHGLYQKDLKMALDLTPGRVAEFSFVPDRTGRFMAICDHFCGSGHGNMKLVINVE